MEPIYQQPVKPPNHKRTGCIIAAIAATLLALIIGGCGAIGLLGSWGMSMVNEQAIEALNENPVIEEHLGEIKTLKLRFMDSADEADDETFVYDAKATKSPGVVTVKLITVDVDTEKVGGGSLEMPDGQTFSLDPAESD